MSAESYFHDIVSGRATGAIGAALRGGLAALEIPYRWAIAARNARFDRGGANVERVAAPVISVGNLTVGGSGKTPLVAWLGEWLTARQIAATIISRGYGAKRAGPNDEALELAARLPHIPHLQNPHRALAARQALAAQSRQVLILDDAFQHRRLARDLDIVLLDALEPFGYDHLLPRGLLREPVANLARAQVIGLSRSDAVSAERRAEIEARVKTCAPAAHWLELVHQPVRLVSARGQSCELGDLHGQRVAAFCGIGNPRGFRHSLESAGLIVADLLALPDHCHYDAPVWNRVTAWAQSLGSVAAVICTRKDLVKIPQEEIAGRPLWALEVVLQIVRGQESFEARLTDVIRALRS